MADHGRLFDNFSASASHTHGGSYFDAGFGLQTLQDAHGKLYDLFGVPKDGSSKHGERYDEFGWEAMPAIHGQHFDSDFQLPTANTGEHATWFDAFRGGAQVRYMLDGADYEGTVIECNREYATVKAKDGQTHEVGLSQFLAYRTPNEQQASPDLPASDAEAPSAHDPTAHGNFGTTGEPALTTEPSVTERVSEGPGNPDRRTGLPSALMDTFVRLGKRRASDVDVAKVAPTHACKNCGAAYAKQGAQFHRVSSGGVKDKIGTSATVGSCSNCGKPAFSSIVAKSVDVTETATQGQPTDSKATVKTVGHRNNCPRGGSAPCGGSVDGRCSLCRAQVHDHDAVGKANTGDLGIEVPERSHPESDHHSSQRKPGRCPHCGAVLDELEHQSEQGQPSRTHKCVGTGLDVLKTLTEATQ